MNVGKQTRILYFSGPTLPGPAYACQLTTSKKNPLKRPTFPTKYSQEKIDSNENRKEQDDSRTRLTS